MRVLTFYLSLIISLLSNQLVAQSEDSKLVVGIVVDQMRYDYIDRYWSEFGEEGFKTLVNQGFFARSVNYHYKPTYTGPGHASIFTGASPSKHGIVGNNWYSRSEEKEVYCAESLKDDGSYWMSPQRLKGRTIADEIKLSRGAEVKSYGISLKDRGAILPAGFLADAAFWFSSDEQKWISSEFYTNNNPEWLKEFNEQDLVDKYLSNPWKLSLSEENYAQSSPDENNYETPLFKNGGTTFPYNLLEAYRQEGIGILKSIPQGNTMTTDLAIQLIQSEKLGEDEVLDFLSISYSATDYVGHRFGVGSREVHDTYIKLDQDIARLISYLNTTIGKDKYLLFLTSDHGAGEVRNSLKEKNLPHGKIETKKLKEELDSALDAKFGPSEWISSFINLNVYLNNKSFESGFVEKQKIVDFLVEYIKTKNGVLDVWTQSHTVSQPYLNLLTANGFLNRESGDLIMVEQASWTNYSDKGSTHGSPYHYDTHVPLLIYGNGVSRGQTFKAYTIAEIAPTIAQLLKVPCPELSEGEVIKELFK